MSVSPTILAVETSSHQGSIAIASGASILEERPLQGSGRRHAQTLIMEIDQLLRDHDQRPAAIDAVAVSYGPGSFTGLRVGVTFAKTFCWANDAKIIAVDTLQALAQRVESSVRRVATISDAQRNELFYNEYIWDPISECRQPVGKVGIESIDSVLELCQKPELILTGPGIEKHSAVVSELPMTPSDLWQPVAGPVAILGAVAFAKQDFADLYALEPLYIRRSYAEENSVKT